MKRIVLQEKWMSLQSPLSFQYLYQHQTELFIFLINSAIRLPASISVTVLFYHVYSLKFAYVFPCYLYQLLIISVIHSCNSVGLCQSQPASMTSVGFCILTMVFNKYKNCFGQLLQRSI